MNPDRWNRASELFQAALDRDRAERTSFLAAACADDLALRAEVESLLVEHERAGDFLNSPACGAAVSALREASSEDSISPDNDPYLGMTVGNRYRIDARLGRGGQALVYLARDMVVMSKRVVIKILHTGQHASMRNKFQQEMEALSRIDHPGIVGVLDTGELPNGTEFLVVQYVDGLTLRQELEKGPLDQTRAAAILRQIGAALDASHALGVAHRDLKPENIMLQRLSDGTELVKLIDFGIAKVEKLASAPTTTSIAVIGTIRYMAPEQFQGEHSSASDVYALGLIACEMLCGRPDFYGLEAPGRVRDHIHGALAYRPQDRPQRAGEFCTRLADALSETAEEDAPRRVVVGPRARLAGAVATVVLTTVAVALFYSQRASLEPDSIGLSLAPPDGTTFEHFAVSPDGREIAVVATDSAGKTQIWVRPLAAFRYEPLAGTEGAKFPFWSADGRFIAFFADKKLKRITSSGGPTQTICNTETGSRGGAWNRDGVILFSPNPATSLYRVSAAGGEPVSVTTLDPSKGESSHSSPQFLPDGRHFLFFSDSKPQETSGIYVASLDSAARVRLLATSSSAVYASGHLLFQRDRALMAQAFDSQGLRLTGEAIPIAENLGGADLSGRSSISVSESGVLAYDSRNPGSHTQLVWFDRGGKKLGTVGSASGAARYLNINLSRDESRVAVDRPDALSGARDIWLFDLARGSESRLTFDPSTEGSPVWSPDGSHLVFFSTRDGTWNLYQKVATGAGNEERLLVSSESKIPCDWSLDGRSIIFREWHPVTNWDLWILPLERDRKPFPIVQTPFEDKCGQLSPDGRWLAFVFGEPGGQEQVYIQPVSSGPTHTARWQVSVAGGAEPRWRRDGSELFYLSLDRTLMAVPVTSEATSEASFQAGAPKALFQTRAGGFFRYDVTADGHRFLVNTILDESTAALPTIILNWPARLKR